MSRAVDSIDQLSVNTIRTLSIDAIQKANSGHPGLPLGAAPMAYTLWQRHLNHNPADTSWANRDRFILSAGHGSALIYSLLHLTGYDLSLDDIKNFRQWDSKTPGHPEFGHVPGVEATTGPLGQGIANAVGMAMSERILANRYNTEEHAIVDHFTYALSGDGDLMEGVAYEACSLAGHLKLGKLIVLYDANDISLDGPTELSFTEDVAKRFEASEWQVLHVADGDTDLMAIDEAIAAAKQETAKPSIIIIKTTIGFGSPAKAGSASAHGAPLGEDEIAKTKAALNWPGTESFFVPQEVAAHMGQAKEKGAATQQAWNTIFTAWAEKNPEKASEWETLRQGKLPQGWEAALPSFEAGTSLATRISGSNVLAALSDALPNLVGGAADLSCSTKSIVKDSPAFDGQSGAGRNIFFGVREHAMASIANGMSYYGMLRPFVSTFMVFSDYMRPTFRLAAMNNLPVVYVFTHDSLAVGEDGPTHQPVEHLTAMRTVPGLNVIRPCDANEAAEAWRYAMEDNTHPTALIFSRQNLPTLDRSVYAEASQAAKGAYVLSDSKEAPKAIIIASGSEVHLALDAQKQLADKNIPVRVVSMPCQEAFEAQSKEYKELVLPSSITARVSVEAGITLGWERYIGISGIAIGVDTYGASAPGNTVMEKYNFTSANVVNAVQEVLAD